MRWTWDELQDLPFDVYQVLIEELQIEQQELAAKTEAARQRANP